MELCTQCNKPESEHTRRVFGHPFKRPTPNQHSQAEDAAYYPNYAGDLVEALSDAVVNPDHDDQE